MVTWGELKALKLPLWEVLTAMVVVAGICWGAFAWADELEDQQRTTQGQLDQLVLIVSKTTTDNSETHEVQEEDLNEIEKAFALLKQELELRRELEATDNGGSS